MRYLISFSVLFFVSSSVWYPVTFNQKRVGNIIEQDYPPLKKVEELISNKDKRIVSKFSDARCDVYTSLSF